MLCLVVSLLNLSRKFLDQKVLDFRSIMLKSHCLTHLNGAEWKNAVDLSTLPYLIQINSINNSNFPLTFSSRASPYTCTQWHNLHLIVFFSTVHVCRRNEWQTSSIMSDGKNSLKRYSWDTIVSYNIKMPSKHRASEKLLEKIPRRMNRKSATKAKWNGEGRRRENQFQSGAILAFFNRELYIRWWRRWKQNNGK